MSSREASATPSLSRSQQGQDSQPQQQLQGTRPAISDGKASRSIWRPTDGNGDPDIGIFEASRYHASGHPTWKVYCGDAPCSLNGAFAEPPKHVYLDDKACFKILHFAGYNGAERGRHWRHDFDNKGGVKPHRKQRGRPAIAEGGGIVEVNTSVNKTYRFGGAVDPKDIDLINQELAAQAKGEVLTVMPTKPGRKPNTIASKPKRKISDELVAGVDTAPTRVKDDDSEIAVFRDPRNKKQRLNDETFTAMSSNSVSEMKGTIVALQDRARITSDALLDLQKRNAELEAGLKSQQILYNRAAHDLSQARNLNATLSLQLKTALPSATPSMQKDMEIASYRNQAAIYRTIAIQLWGKQASSAVLLEKAAAATIAIEALTETLADMRGELAPLRIKQEGDKESWQQLDGAVRTMLGDEFEKFDKEAQDRFTM